jgi:tetratricopeptide (TPR) repeat protein
VSFAICIRSITDEEVSMKNTVALLLFVFAAGTSQSLAQGVDERLKSELVRLHTEWFAAYDQGDGPAMDRMEVPNFALVMPDGSLWKKEAPRKATGKRTGYTSRTLTDVNVRQFGDTAILTGTVASEPAMAGDDKAGTTVVFVRPTGEWRLASAQWTLKDQPEEAINRAGYALMTSGKVTEAIELLNMNVRLYPQSWNAYDSLGEAYAKAGKTALAIQNYEKSVQLNPKNDTGVAALKMLKGKEGTRSRRLPGRLGQTVRPHRPHDFAFYR